MTEITPRRLVRNNKRGPKKKAGDNNRALYKKVKQIHPGLLYNSITYILQTSDALISGSGVITTANLFHAYGLRHACELIERFIFNENNKYRESILTRREINEVLNPDSTDSDKL